MSPAEAPIPVDPAPPGPPPGRAGRRHHPLRWLGAHRFQVTLTLLIVAFVLVAFWREILVPKHAGEQGVYWSRFFGGTSDLILGEGTHLKFPWDDIIIYNTRVQETSGTTGMLTRDGMSISVQWSARYRVEPEHLPELHRTVGPLYAQKVIIPEVVSGLRKVLGNYTAEQIYAQDELSLLGEVDRTVKQQVHSVHPLILESVLILRLDLPQEMARGIVDKLLFEQTLLAYRFRLGAEEEERKRKLIEAQGIRDFENLTGISMLRWRGIDATQELAKSPNAKIIIMGTGQANLPVLLNADQAAPAAPAASARALPGSPAGTTLPGTGTLPGAGNSLPGAIGSGTGLPGRADAALPNPATSSR